MILIIDDDHAVTASLALLLKQAGFASTAAASPDEAIDVLRRQPCQLVIQDMNFSRRTSGEEGLALLQRINADAGAAGGADHGLGPINLAAEDEGRRRRLRHQAVDQPADAETVKTTLGLAARGPPPTTTPPRATSWTRADFGALVGRDPKTLRVLRKIGVAATQASVASPGRAAPARS
jgi:DNA-binding NtrC family response regulator